MTDSGIDDDQPEARLATAKGYKPIGLYDPAAAAPIHWSAKAGNGSAYTTAGDELKFVGALVGSHFLTLKQRDTMFDLGARVGYGWFKSNSARFGEPVERPRAGFFVRRRVFSARSVIRCGAQQCLCLGSRGHDL